MWKALDIYCGLPPHKRSCREVHNKLMSHYRGFKAQGSTPDHECPAYDTVKNWMMYGVRLKEYPWLGKPWKELATAHDAGRLYVQLRVFGDTREEAAATMRPMLEAMALNAMIAKVQLSPGKVGERFLLEVYALAAKTDTKDFDFNSPAFVAAVKNSKEMQMKLAQIMLDEMEKEKK
jgi:hypothetical protein